MMWSVVVTPRYLPGRTDPGGWGKIIREADSAAVAYHEAKINIWLRIEHYLKTQGYR